MKVVAVVLSTEKNDGTDMSKAAADRQPFPYSDDFLGLWSKNFQIQ